MPPSIVINTLGVFEIYRDGRQVGVERTKHKALLAYLSVNRGRWCQRNILADLLWESSSEEKAKHSLNQALYSLRRLIPEILHVKKESVRCDDNNVITDLDRVAEFINSGNVHNAIMAMRGAFLENVDIRHAPEFERWKSNFNRQFYQSSQRVLLSLIRNLSTEDRYAVQKHSHFFSHMPELQEMLSSAIASSEILTDHVDQAEVHIPIRQSLTLPFVGREAAMTALRSALRDSESHESSFVVITGQPGIGKTRLAEEFLKSVTNVRHLHVKCYEAEQRVGFGPIVDLFTNGFSTTDLAGLQPIWKTVLGELIPEYAANVAPPRLSGLSGQSRLFQAVLQAFKELAKESRILLFVDDVQWMDRSTRALFSFLTHRLEGERVMVIAALRRKSMTSPISSPWNTWRRIEIGELARDHAVRVVNETAALMRISTVPLQSILNLTGGHPYLLSEVLGRVASGSAPDVRVLEREIPPRVEEFVSALFQSLPKDSQTLLAVLALLGRPAPAHILRRISRLKNLSEPLDTLVEREIASVSTNGIGLRHDLIREAAYRRIPLFTRTALHRRAATALSGKQDLTGESAEHFYKGGLKAMAFKKAITAAQIADKRHAFDESVSFLKLAARARPSQNRQVLPVLAERLYRLHRFREARAALQRGLHGDRRPSLELQILDLELAYSIGEIDGSKLRSETLLLKRSNVPIDRALKFRLLRLEVRSAHHDGVFEAAAAAVKELQELALQMPGYEGLEAVAYAGRAQSLLLSSVDAEIWVSEAVKRVNGIPENEIGIRTMGLYGTILYEVGKLQAAEAMHQKALQSVEAIGAISEWPLLAVHNHMLLVEQGKFNSARELAKEVRSRVLPAETARVFATLAANEAGMNYELQNYDDAEKLVTETLTYVSATSSIWVELEITGLRGLICLAQGRVAEAQRCNTTAKAGIAKLGYRCGDVSSIEILNSRLHHRRGATDLAIEQLNEAIADYRERDVMCRLRMELELARLLKSTDRSKSRVQANNVFAEATRIGARPLAEQADALLIRL